MCWLLCFRFVVELVCFCDLRFWSSVYVGLTFGCLLLFDGVGFSGFVCWYLSCYVLRDLLFVACVCDSFVLGALFKLCFGRLWITCLVLIG